MGKIECKNIFKISKTFDKPYLNCFVYVSCPFILQRLIFEKNFF